MSTGGVLTQLKQPEYTGENRCGACTVVNLAIAVVASAAVGLGGAMAAAPAVGAAAGATVFGLSLVAIYFRGYLVPGTPSLTKRYFPAWLLSAFGKAPEPTAGGAMAPSDAGDEDRIDDVDPEVALVEAGALEECEDGDDLCLTDDFRTDWHEEVTHVREADAGRERLLALLDVDEGEVSFSEYGDAFAASVDGQTVGKWESEAALFADLGAAELLAWRVPEWGDLSVTARSQLLNGLRLFIDECPACGATPEFGTETVESCCSTREVAAVSCPDCEARLFESPVA